MNEHPFAQYVRILGRGKKGARSLNQQEAYAAMSMILADQVEPVQLGAFLMLLRVKEESAEELAGFVAAARDSLALPNGNEIIDLDWPSYAGKRRHLPWFVLSALLLAQNNVSVLMHGTRGNKDDRVYTEDALQALGIPPSENMTTAITDIEQNGFAFVALESFHGKLKAILNLRSRFGLRSPINTLLRLLNPAHAPYSMQSTFHPNYRQTHQQAAILLGQPHMAVFKGDGGEIERCPDQACQVYTVHEAVAGEENWPALFDKRQLKARDMDAARLKSVWLDEVRDDYGVAAVIGTVAVTLKLLGHVQDIEEAQAQAAGMWRERSDRYYRGAVGSG